MTRDPEFPLELDAGGGRVLSARWRPCVRARSSPILLAHGAGAGHASPLLAELERCLAEQRFEILSFHYPFLTRMLREGRRRPPDPRAVLEAAHERALEELARLRPGARALLAGKSLGGRIGSLIAARGADAAGLVLVGYPLHPAGRPSGGRSAGRAAGGASRAGPPEGRGEGGAVEERVEHFPALAQPALFLSGTRDALCELPRLRRALTIYGGTATLEVVEGADHDFARPGRRDPGAAARDLTGRIVGWFERTWPGD